MGEKDKRGIKEGNKMWRAGQTAKRRRQDGPSPGWKDERDKKWEEWSEERARLREEAMENKMTVEEWEKVKKKEAPQVAPEAVEATRAERRKEKKKQKKLLLKMKKAATKAKDVSAITPERTY